VRRDGSSRLVTPHLLCDVAGDGQSLLARTAEGEIVAVSLRTGSVLASYGLGEAAAWRPVPSGPPPASPLADRSPTLSAREPQTRGDAVREAQQRLNRLGYNAGEVDGVYGPMTTSAVRAFQQRSGLKVDGVISPQTWAALRSPPPCPASGSPDLCQNS
jgi:peptidoglycan hydrolase-like protein with peptidoglycan-binding domain